MTNIKRLTCCCCGTGTRGRQWHNRDTGYGLCESCADWIRTRQDGKHYDAAEFERCYGRKGEHYAVDEPSRNP